LIIDQSPLTPLLQRGERFDIQCDIEGQTRPALKKVSSTAAQGED
jgi:hypothetical protein